jgi:hypothetical protein
MIEDLIVLGSMYSALHIYQLIASDHYSVCVCVSSPIEDLWNSIYSAVIRRQSRILPKEWVQEWQSLS